MSDKRYGYFRSGEVFSGAGVVRTREGRATISGHAGEVDIRLLEVRHLGENEMKLVPDGLFAGAFIGSVVSSVWRFCDVRDDVRPTGRPAGAPPAMCCNRARNAWPRTHRRAQATILVNRQAQTLRRNRLRGRAGTRISMRGHL